MSLQLQNSSQDWAIFRDQQTHYQGSVEIYLQMVSNTIGRDELPSLYSLLLNVKWEARSVTAVGRV